MTSKVLTYCVQGLKLAGTWQHLTISKVLHYCLKLAGNWQHLLTSDVLHYYAQGLKLAGNWQHPVNSKVLHYCLQGLKLTASNDLKRSALLCTGFKTGRQLLLEAPSVCSRRKVLQKLELCRLSELEVWQSLAPAPKCYSHTPHQYPSDGNY